MQRAPAEPGESIFARGIGRYIIRIGIVFALLVIGLMVYASSHSPEHWKTMEFTTLCLAQMGHALSARSDRPLLQVAPFSNPWLLWAVVLTSALQLLLLYVPALSSFFGTTPLSGDDLLVCVGVSLLFLVYLEAEKLSRQWWSRQRAEHPLRHNQTIRLNVVIEQIPQLLLAAVDANPLLGYLAITLVMLLENVVPPIPSEVVMPLAGFLIQQGKLELLPVLLAGLIGTVLGAWFWYGVGRLINEERLERWLAKHGR